MPFLTLKFSGDRADEVVEVEGEARLVVSPFASFAFGGPEGLVDVAYSDEDPRLVEAPAPKKASAKKSK